MWEVSRLGEMPKLRFRSRAGWAGPTAWRSFCGWVGRKNRTWQGRERQGGTLQPRREQS